jgi:DNA-directed RNA polymerase specialized sigma24 family protein
MQREAVETAVSRFAELSTVQRSVVILKDVLDQSLESPVARRLKTARAACARHLPNIRWFCAMT